MKNKLLRRILWLVFIFDLMVFLSQSNLSGPVLIVDKYETDYAYYITYTTYVNTHIYNPGEVDVKVGNKISIINIPYIDEDRNETKLNSKEAYEILTIGKKIDIEYLHYNFFLKSKKITEIREIKLNK